MINNEIKAAETAQAILDACILTTPTGEFRNTLTQENIKLLSKIERLKNLKELRDELKTETKEVILDLYTLTISYAAYSQSLIQQGVIPLTYPEWFANEIQMGSYLGKLAKK